MKTLKNAMKKFVADEQGLETVEYAVMTPLIVAALVAAIAALTGAVSGRLTGTATTITNLPG